MPIKNPLIRLLLVALLVPLAGLRAQSYYDPPYAISTYAGAVPVFGASDGTGPAAQFYSPVGVAMDAAGNTYVADASNHTIRKVTPLGVVTTFAGSAGNFGTADGTGSAARFKNPQGVAVDAAGNVYVADRGSHTIRFITPAGVVTTLAGSAGTAGSADGTGSAARFNSPFGIAVSAAGDAIYIADSSNHTIRKITTGAVVATLAGFAGNSGSSDGTGIAASFFVPRGLAVDVAGNVFVADTGNHTIRRITPAGAVTTFAGTAGLLGSVEGNGSAARFNRPFGIAVDSAGNLFVADLNNHTIRKITPGGDVTTLAGRALSYGSGDGSGSAARFYFPTGVAVNSSGQLSVADSSNNTIRSVTSGGIVTTLAGTATYGSADGTGGAAQFQSPQGVAADAAGNVYVADSINHLIRKIAPGGVVTTLAGTPGTPGAADGTGAAAQFNAPFGIAVDSTGNVYVADANSTIRKITSAGVVTTLAGSAGVIGSADGTGAAANFNTPAGLATDVSGNVYVADWGNHTIRKITAAGEVTTLAGTATVPGSADGTGTAARFKYPLGVALDSAGNVYVADSGNRCVRKITPGGVVTQFAAEFSYFTGANDGTGLEAHFDSPTGIATDAAGNLYVTDSVNQTLRKIRPDGLVSTLAGFTASAGSADGTGRAARFNSPAGVAVDGAGNVYIADSSNNTIRKGVEATGDAPYAFSTLAGSSQHSGSSDGLGSAARFYGFSGITNDSSGNAYVADSGNNLIRMISPAGLVTTVAGQAGSFVSWADGTGSAARFSSPLGVVYDGAGVLYVADSGNRVIRKIAPGGVVTTFAGSPGIDGNTDGTGSAARFGYMRGIAIDSEGNLWVTDGNCVRKITPAGVVTTIAGVQNSYGFVDGTGSAARFGGPVALAVNAAGIVYVTDSANHVVRRIAPGGAVTTFAGSPAGNQGALDGVGNAALFGNLTGLAMDGAGNVYVIDDWNCVRKITPAAEVTTLAGLATTLGGDSDGMESVVRFNGASAIAVDPAAANIYVADSGNYVIRRGTRVTDPAPAIIHQPENLLSIAAQPAKFAAGARGLPSPTLKWQRLPVGGGGWTDLSNGSTYTGVTTTQLTISSATLGMRGDQFRCVATNTSGSVVSDAASLYVYVPASAQGVANQTAVVGTPAIFSATIGGDPAPTVRWQIRDSGGVWTDLVEGATYTGVTTPNLTVTHPVLEMNNSIYRCIATNIGGSSTSNFAILTVIDPPVFTSQPGNQVVGAGSFTTFTVAVSGTPVPTLQWQRRPFGSSTWTNLATGGVYSGANQSALYVIPVSVMMNGDQFRCVATNSADTATSATATLVVRIAPFTRTNDFTGDGRSDVLWTNTLTGERTMWQMYDGVALDGVSLGTVPTNWKISGTGDFNGDGKADVLLSNSVTGDRAMWLMSAFTIASNLYLGNVPVEWVISAVGDFNGDGKADIFWSNTVTGDRSMWLMNGGTVTEGAYLGSVPVDWKVSGAGDFNGDGRADLVWTNTTTGERAIWLMNGGVLLDGASLGTVPTDWTISGVGDFDEDGKSDIVLSNTSTGDRAMWLMNGMAISSNLYLGNVPTAWTLSSVADFNGDGKSDMFWSNTVTGDRSVWLMNGGTVVEGNYLGSVPVEWVTTP